MFYESESMKDIIDYSLSKPDYSIYLVISEFFGRENSEDNQFFSFLEQWKSIVKECLSQDDAAHVINKGNILVLVHKNNENIFRKTLSNTFITSEQQTSGVRSSLVQLKEKDVRFLMNIF
jgi:hypothetical protein